MFEQKTLACDDSLLPGFMTKVLFVSGILRGRPLKKLSVSACGVSTIGVGLRHYCFGPMPIPVFAGGGRGRGGNEKAPMPQRAPGLSACLR